MEYNLPISTLIEKLKTSFFNEDWLKVADNKEVADYKDLWINNILKASTEIFKYYILLLLSGEYCRLVDKDSEELRIKDLEACLETISNQIEVKEDIKIQYELQSIFSENVLYPLRRIIKPHIDYLTRDLKVQFGLEHKRQLIRGDKKEDTPPKTDQEVIAYSDALKYIIFLTRIEHFWYHHNEEVMKELLILEKEIQSLLIPDDSLKKAILVKLNFLLRKILYRKSSSTSEDTAELIYSFDQQEDKELSVGDIPLDDKLIEWDNLIKSHYGFNSRFKSEQRKRAQVIYQKDESGYCFKDFHGLIKIYKDDTKSSEQTANLLVKFNERKFPSILTIDDYAKKITQTYLFNNAISLRCENAKITYEQSCDIYEEIRNHQNISNVRNYFPWEKLAQTIGNKIDGLLNDLVNKDKYKQFRVLLQLYSKALSKFEETLKWSKIKRFLPFQMPFSECQSEYLVEIEEYPPVKLFFFSSFLLPLDYLQVSKSKDELRLRKLKYDTLDTVYDKLQHVVEDVNESSEKMRKQERRSVEILAIFAAVALFSMGSIQIFSNQAVANDPHVYYRFIMAFGYSLALFVLLIWIITRDDIKRVHIFHWIIVALVFISSCIAIGYFVGDPLFDMITGKSNK